MLIYSFEAWRWCFVFVLVGYTKVNFSEASDLRESWKDPRKQHFKAQQVSGV